MIRYPIDVASRVSPELSLFVDTLLQTPDADQSVSLGMVRSTLIHMMGASLTETEQMHHFDVSESLIHELDELIEEYGEDATAISFVRIEASEPLSRVIESVVNDENRENPPTLAIVKNAIVDGLGAKLVGEGVLEEDEDDGLLDEINGLIDRLGEDTLAEGLLRYE